MLLHTCTSMCFVNVSCHERVFELFKKNLRLLLLQPQTMLTGPDFVYAMLVIFSTMGLVELSEVRNVFKGGGGHVRR